jgi:hypothetical protein
MIDAYLDEVGIHEGAAMCFIAGFFGGRGQWRKLEAGWMRTLDRFNVPLDEFHGLEAVKRRKFFAHWDEDKHERFLDELSTVVTQFKVYPISFGIVVQDFLSFSENQRRFLTGMEVTPDLRLTGTGNPNKPYFTPFMHTIKRVASYAPVGGRAHFFFGLDRPFYGYAQEMFRILENSTHAGGYRERLGDTSAPMAKETPQLQAADYFAYLTYDHARECMNTGNWFRVAIKPLDMIVRHARSLDDHVFYNKQTLTFMLTTLPPEVQVLLS